MFVVSAQAAGGGPGAAEAVGDAGHGAAAEALALPPPRQPVPKQGGEASARPALKHEPHPGTCVRAFVCIFARLLSVSSTQPIEFS